MIGQTIKHYKVLEKLGEGGMGVVYKAQDSRLDRTVALKFLGPQLLGDDEAKARFLREAIAAAGQGLALSPDGGRALTFELSDPPQIVIRPTGAGEPVRLVNPGFTGFSGGDWHPNGDRVLFTANAGGTSRVYMQDLDGGAPQSVTPEGVHAGFGERIVSPDGKWILGETVAREVVVYPLDGGEPRVIAVPASTEGIAGWSADSSSIYVFGSQWGKPNQVFEIRMSDGETSLWKELNHPDPAGIVAYWGLQISDDEQSYCYSYMRNLSSLYLVEGLR